MWAMPRVKSTSPALPKSAQGFPESASTLIKRASMVARNILRRQLAPGFRRVSSQEDNPRFTSPSEYFDPRGILGSKLKGRIDIVFASAGVGEFVPFGAVTEEHFDKLCNINVRGALFTVQKA
jgi:hypothetical protein